VLVLHLLELLAIAALYHPQGGADLSEDYADAITISFTVMCFRLHCGGHNARAVVGANIRAQAKPY
jgi:hypothetical protein